MSKIKEETDQTHFCYKQTIQPHTSAAQIVAEMMACGGNSGRNIGDQKLYQLNFFLWVELSYVS